MMIGGAVSVRRSAIMGDGLASGLGSAIRGVGNGAAGTFGWACGSATTGVGNGAGCVVSSVCSAAIGWGSGAPRNDEGLAIGVFVTCMGLTIDGAGAGVASALQVPISARISRSRNSDGDVNDFGFPKNGLDGGPKTNLGFSHVSLQRELRKSPRQKNRPEGLLAVAPAQSPFVAGTELCDGSGWPVCGPDASAQASPRPAKATSENKQAASFFFIFHSLVSDRAGATNYETVNLSS